MMKSKLKASLEGIKSRFRLVDLTLVNLSCCSVPDSTCNNLHKYDASEQRSYVSSLSAWQCFRRLDASSHFSSHRVCHTTNIVAASYNAPHTTLTKMTTHIGILPDGTSHYSLVESMMITNVARPQIF
jgi:hypothetical protein